MPEPKQRRGESKQDYRTPARFIAAVKARLGINHFAHDFAADATNTQAGEDYSDIHTDALSYDAETWASLCGDGWGWLNPPFANIRPWAERCAATACYGGQIALLVPAAVGANWFRDHVANQAQVLFLNGRLDFIPGEYYPKDCILCLFGVEPGYQVWNWREEGGE